MIALKGLFLQPIVKIFLFGILVFSASFLVNTSPLNLMIRKLVLSCIILTITGLFLKYEYRQFRSVGIHFKRKSLKYFSLGALIGIGMLITTSFVTKGLIGFNWELNINGSFSSFFLLLNFFFWSVLIEELMFRGYGFQRLAEYKGKWVALITIGFLFGLIHIRDTMSFSEITVTMIATGIGHIFFGLAVLRTRNLALPFGLHLGWNFAQVLIPRYPDLNNEGSIFHILPGDAIEYNPLLLLIPYFIVMIFGCLFLLYYKNNPKAHYISNPEN